MHIEPFKALLPNFDLLTDVQGYMKDVRNDYHKYANQDIFHPSDKDQFILYRIQSPGFKTDGLVCLTNIQDMVDGLILRHEKTLEEKENEQLSLYKERRAVVKPVLLTYPGHEVFDEYLQTLRTDDRLVQKIYLDDKEEEHFFWRVDDQANIEHIKTYFETEIKRSYIADGHHRLSTFVRLREEGTDLACSHLMCVYIPFEDLRIHAFHRIVTVDPSFDKKQFLKSLKELCFIEEATSQMLPSFKYNFLCHIGRKTYACVWKPSFLNKFSNEPLLLDTAMINVAIFRDILHIKDVRTDSRINYVEGFKGWDGFKKAIDKNKNSIGFFLYPVDFDDFMKVSDLLLTLPPKSTWFEPRIRNGLTIQQL